ncbi:acyl-CoA dehydrogenase family protein [Komagataeibacter sp. FNDCR2]|uniref:acyl-CoA dehydrogenase family protein n=1 Tax=Komagataeibacter sp. FNDCR2 TaxID=2878682 RepID=UPI001E47B666|nr:acyl-CoA dehydrogenase family protein [Komagataeibacter sp. FNDCR2]MCE2574158.1 acyl-CoA/acyl-ACP dehydrogenase [Komagataeibacter sp. FNDCR2]
MTFPFAALAACRAELEEEATANDAQALFPLSGLSRLRQLGVLSAVLPRTLGGCGFGTEPDGALGLLHLLRLTGQASLSLGRIVEGHVNAIRLISRYGTTEQLARAAEDVHDGALFGVWVTEGGTPLRMEWSGDTIMLQGRKILASGAFHVTRALVTAHARDNTTRMLLVPLDAGHAAYPSMDGIAGMRGAGTGNYDFNGTVLQADGLIGQADDYLRQPEFSAGAWRAMAVALGGIERLTTLLRGQLVERGRADSPAQQVRIGTALIAAETALLWTRRAALIASGQTRHEAGDITATVNLARHAVERAGLDVIEVVQRGLGLSAFVRTNIVERLNRDLATYLRQPAPDEALAEAAQWFTRRDLPQTEAAP